MVNSFKSDKIYLSRILGNSIFFILLFSFFFFFLSFIFQDLLFFVTSFHFYIFILIGIDVIFMTLSKLLLSLWRIKGYANKYGFFSILKLIINISITFFLITYLNLSWLGRILAILITNVLFGSFSLLFFIITKNISFKFDFSILKKIFFFGLPLIPHTLSSAFISSSNRFFLLQFVGPEGTGLFSFAHQIGSVISLITLSINLAFVPWLFESLKAADSNKKIRIVIFSYFIIGGIIFISLLLGLLGPFIFSMITNPIYQSSYFLVLLICFSYSLHGIYLIFVNYIFFAAKTFKLALISVLSALVSLLANYFFIKTYGVYGAAYSSILSYSIMVVLTFAVSNKVYPMPWLFFLRKH
jgi:O-antigen/teichoic acid export membrane protein